MAQVPNNTIIDGTGQFVLAELQRHYNATRSSFSGSGAPAEPAVGQLWLDTNETPAELKIYNRLGLWRAIPFDTDTGNTLGTSITDIPITSLRQMDIDHDLSGDPGVFLDPTAETAGALVSAAGAKAYVDAETTAREVADTVINSAASTHAADTSTHGVGVIVGTTETQGLSNKAITASTISGTPISGSTGSFSELDIIGDGTDGHGGTIKGTENTLTIDPDPSGPTGTLVVAGNLTVEGMTTTINSTEKSIVDKDLVVGRNLDDSSTDIEVDGSGLHVGASALESWTYSQTKNQWATKDSAVSAKSFKVGDVTVIGTDGKVDLEQLATGTLASGIKIGKSNWNSATTELLGTRQGGTGLGAFAVPEGGLLLGGGLLESKSSMLLGLLIREKCL